MHWVCINPVSGAIQRTRRDVSGKMKAAAMTWDSHILRHATAFITSSSSSPPSLSVSPPSLLLLPHPEEREREMAQWLPVTTPLAQTTGMKSSFLSPQSLGLLSAKAKVASSAASSSWTSSSPVPRPSISMRLASKQAYICRDCGYPFFLSLVHPLPSDNWGALLIPLMIIWVQLHLQRPHSLRQVTRQLLLPW